MTILVETHYVTLSGYRAVIDRNSRTSILSPNETMPALILYSTEEIFEIKRLVDAVCGDIKHNSSV